VTRPPVPAEEAARLEVVHSLGLLDTPQECFDRIARAAPSTARTAAVVATVYDLDETARRSLTIGPPRFVRRGRGEDDVVQALVDAAGVLPGSSA
jgi:DNA-binding NarL/FixJ family response regulator